jgi:hypothetical protein
MIRLLLLGILLTGCTTYWNHSSKDTTSFYADDSDCISRAEGVPYNPYGGSMGAVARRSPRSMSGA